jgi:cobyrinic acid a,c-diamide synthase
MQQNQTEFPRIIIAALRGGSGKTILSIGLIAALSKLGKSIAPFKKGPDYIDAGWLALAAGRPCYNLDSFLLEPDTNFRSFLKHASDCDISLIEGNRGLYDGIDLEGSTSTAELAKLLKAPVVLCVDCTKITRTMAAVVSGCVHFDPEIMIKGVVLNRVANPRHEKKLRDSIEHYCNIPVLGAIPKQSHQYFPERHLGLVPTPEHDWAADSVEAIARIAENHIDLDVIETIARDALQLEEFESGQPETRNQRPACDELSRVEARDRKSEVIIQKVEIQVEHPLPIIGIIKDSAFQFYYPENIDALYEQGAEVVFLSPLKDQALPEVDALYIGGGFPETHAEQLAQNITFSRQLVALVEDGLPIYAECGGLMYLGQELILDGKSFPMAGVLPLVFDFYKRPQGHGYTLVTVEGKNPYFPVGTKIKGHEFHYSRVKQWSGDDVDFVFRMKRGAGIDRDKDGILYKNVLATYTHIHALGTPQWAPALVRNAIRYAKKKPM